MNDFIVMPKALTAENGARALMTGEFCEISNDCKSTVRIQWSTIKDIYKKAVEYFSVIPKIEEQYKNFELLFSCIEYPIEGTFTKFIKNGNDMGYEWKRINDAFKVYQLSKGYV